MFNAAGVNDSWPEDGKDSFTRVLGPSHSGGNFANRNPLRLFARDWAGHELEQVGSRHGIGGQDAQSLPADDNAVPLVNVGHRNAPGRATFGINQDAAVHLLVFDVDPFAAQTD